MKYTSIVLYKFVENILNYYYENSVGTIPAMLIFDISIRCIIIRIIIYIYIYAFYKTSNRFSYAHRKTNIESQYIRRKIIAHYLKKDYQLFGTDQTCIIIICDSRSADN